MRTKVMAFVVIAAATAALFMAIRNDTKAIAADGDCYSEMQGPATPTICE